MTELDKLEAALKERKIKYVREDCEQEIDEKGRIASMDWHQIIVFGKNGQRSWDAVCHTGSYGYKQGLLEVMGQPVVRKRDGDSVAGYLTAEEVIRRMEGQV